MKHRIDELTEAIDQIEADISRHEKKLLKLRTTRSALVAEQDVIVNREQYYNYITVNGNEPENWTPEHTKRVLQMFV